MIEKDKVYVINQPKRIINAIIVVTGDFPLPDSIHEGLDRLQEKADISFIFCNKHYTESSRVNKRKFSQLYRAMSFIDSSGNIGESIFKLLDYNSSLYPNFISYVISDTKKEITSDFCNKLLEVSGSSIIKPILRIKRLGSEELSNLYKNDYPMVEVKESGVQKFLNLLFPGEQIINRYCCKEEDDDLGSYCTHSSDSIGIYFRASTIKILLMEYSSEKMKEIIRTFINIPDPRYIIPSIIKYLDINNLDIDLEKLEINKITA